MFFFTRSDLKIRYLTPINFRAPLVFAHSRCAKIKGGNSAHKPRAKIKGARKIIFYNMQKHKLYIIGIMHIGLVHVGLMGCGTNGLTDFWVVGQMGCRTKGMSD